jgi:ribosomal protein S18 acetylase RimI-like enzyme
VVKLSTAYDIFGDHTWMLVRHATVEDADAMATAHVRAWREAYAGIIPDDFLAALDPVARARSHRSILIEPGRITATFVAVDGAALLGFTHVGPCRDDDESGEVYAIYVHPDHWRHGAGRVLMEAALAHLTVDGPRPVRLWVLEANQPARLFYERHGFVTDGAVRVEEFASTPIAEIRYTRPAGA